MWGGKSNTSHECRYHFLADGIKTGSFGSTRLYALVTEAFDQ